MRYPIFATAVAVVVSLGCARSQQAVPLEGDPPQVRQVSMVAPSIIELVVIAGEVIHGEQLPYEAQPGDRIDKTAKESWLWRDGECIGSLVGSDQGHYFAFDRLEGTPLDTAWASRPESYTIRGPAGDTVPTRVYRKSKPSDSARTAPWEFEASVEHHLFLELPAPLIEGEPYAIEFGDGALAAQSFTFEPAALRSEAVHVTQLGYRPDDPIKVAFLSCWMGDGGGLAYGEALAFAVLDATTGEAVHQGPVLLAEAGDSLEADNYDFNYNRTDVYEMDFSAVTTPGIYRVMVEGVGCSFDFPISEGAWRDAFRISARGFYHQRSGIELGPPYTDFVRPRPFHPDDGVVVYGSTAPLADTGNGLNQNDEGNFGALVAGKTDTIVPNAWGGLMDAGDWDRRIQHLRVSRYLLELMELFPEDYADLDLNIPESANKLPDIVDEALFNLDCYRRMQTEDGGIRGGIESSEHPKLGEASWQESLTVLAYAPCVWSSYIYAGVSARAAGVLRELDPDLAAVYEESALRAMRYAEAHLPERPADDYHQVRDDRNLAAVELYRLTADEIWHSIFKETTVFGQPGQQMFLWQDHDQQEAPWVYLRTDHPTKDAQLASNCLAAILEQANARVAMTRRTGLRWAKDPWGPLAWGRLGAPDAVSLCRAYLATGSIEYLVAAILTCQQCTGANPMNLSYTTGLGARFPQNPLHIDSRVTGQPAPPGLTVFGASEIRQNADDWGIGVAKPFCYPAVEEWPAVEAYFDIFWNAAQCEFVVQGPMSEASYVWGCLAGRD